MVEECSVDAAHLGTLVKLVVSAPGRAWLARYEAEGLEVLKDGWHQAFLQFTGYLRKPPRRVGCAVAIRFPPVGPRRVATLAHFCWVSDGQQATLARISSNPAQRC